MLARLPSLHPTRYQRAFPRHQYWYLAGSGPGSSERPTLTRNLLYLVMRTITCTPVGLGPGLAHTPVKVGLGGLLLLGLYLYAPGDRVVNSHSSPILTGSDVWLPACLPASSSKFLGGTFSACFIILTFLPHSHFCFHMHCHLCTASSFTQPPLVGAHTTICWYLQMLLPHFILLQQIYSAELISSVQTVIICQLHILGHLLTSEFTGRNCRHYIYKVKALFKTCANITYLKMHKHMDRMFAMLCHHQRNIFFFFSNHHVFFLHLCHFFSGSFHSLMHNIQTCLYLYSFPCV